MQSLKIDLEQDEVFVFTPKGKVVTLPTGANPVDFAYAIHTEVGHRCIGARVNGRLVPLDSTLASGDTVEIFTSKVEGAGPSRDWLQFAQTPRARTKIRQWFSRERRVDAIDTGRDELVKALRKEGLPIQTASKLPARHRGDAALRGRRGAAGRDRRGSRLGQGRRAAAAPGDGRRRGADPGHGAAADPQQRSAPARRASTSRGSTTCSSGSRGAAPRCPATRSSGS